MEITVEKGLGYQPVEVQKIEKLSIGTIALDVMYSPVRNVNFSVENMRVGENTDYNRLNFEIETDGTISRRTPCTRRPTYYWTTSTKYQRSRSRRKLRLSPSRRPRRRSLAQRKLKRRRNNAAPKEGQ